MIWRYAASYTDRLHLRQKSQILNPEAKFGPRQMYSLTVSLYLPLNERTAHIKIAQSLTTW